MKPEDNGAARTCETPGCDKEARLQCPTCIKLKIEVYSVSFIFGKFYLVFLKDSIFYILDIKLKSLKLFENVSIHFEDNLVKH